MDAIASPRRRGVTLEPGLLMNGDPMELTRPYVILEMNRQLTGGDRVHFSLLSENRS